MSTTVDSRVVQMSFDNKNFESNVQTSLSTLDKLKKSLNMDGATKGLENIDATSRKINFGPLSDAVDTVKTRFSAMEVIAITALANITNSVLNCGKQMLKSLTVDPIKEGFSEYELKMGSVQTIMAGTGASLDEVMKKLNELNEYSDKTIYSFADMTTNIGKFTNAGVKLDDAVAAIQGVSNVAAVSGANANEASRAMYNFAQALSSGYVKLIDWKSIENANMATVEFKNYLLEAAVAAGTVEKTADGMYKVLTTNAKGQQMGEAISATKMFNDSLQYQWMTTEVLTSTLKQYSDETTEIGKKAFAAAQDVKTFSQLMDTLKEAVGSGWAETWEIVFGNFEEAKALWTEVSNVVGGFISSQSEARNTMLQEWKDLGGRTHLIDTFKNSLQAVSAIIKPIGDAFREIFPETTGKQLADITKKISEFTSKLKVSDERAGKIKSTFKGVFAVLSIGKEALTAIVSGLFELGSAISKVIFPMGDGLLSTTAGFGEFLVNLDKTIKETGLFKAIIGSAVDFIISIPNKIDKVFNQLTGISIGDAFTVITETISGALENIKGFFGEFGNIDTSGIDNLTNRVKIRFEPLSGLFDGIKKVFGGFWEFLKAASPIFLGLATALGNALVKLGSTMKEKIQEADFNTVLDIVNSGVLVAIGLGIKKFVDGLTEITSNAGGMLGSIKDILDGVKGCFQAWQKDIQAGTLLKIAGAIGVITVSLVALSLIDSKKLTAGLAALSGEMIALFTMFKALSKIDAKGTTKASATLILMSTAILLLTGACAKLAQLEWDGILKGVTGIAGLSAILVVVARQLSNNTGSMMKGTLGLVAFAGAINLMVPPMKELSQLSVAELTKGLVAVGVLCAEIAAFLKVADLDKMGVLKGVGLVALAGSITILADAIGKFAQMDIGKMIQGLAGVALVLTEIAVFTKFTGNSASLIATASGMVVLGAAMLIFGEAIEKIGKLSIEELVKGLAGMAFALTEVIIALNLIPPTIIAQSAGLLVASAALVVLANAFKAFGSMSWEEIAKGLVAMGVALLEVAVALMAMNATLPGSAALLVASAALMALAPALKIMGSMSCGEIGKSLVAMAGAFTVLGVAGLLLGPISPLILALAAAVTLLGIGALACGAGVLMLSTGLAALSVSGVAGITALVLAIQAIIGLIPAIAVEIGKGLINIVKIIGESAVTICETVTNVGLAVIEALIALVPKLVELIVVLAQAIADGAPKLYQAGIDLLKGFLNTISKNIKDIAEAGADVVIAFIEGIGEQVPRIIQAGIDVVFNLIEGFGQGIEDNADRLHDAFISLFEHLLEAILKLLGIHSPSTVFAEIGTNIVLGLIKGVGDKFTEFMNKVVDLFNKAKTAVINKLSEWYETGKEIIDKVITGVGDKVEAFKTKVKDLIDTGVTTVKNKVGEWLSAGKELIDNVVTGIGNKASAFTTKVTNLINDGKTMIKNKFTEWLNAGQDLINNIVTGVGNKVETFKTKVTGLINSGKTMITNKFSEWLSSGQELFNKVITGVGDKMESFKSKVTSAVNSAKTMISNKYSEWTSSGQELLNKVITGVGDKMESFKSKVTSAVNSAKTMISNKYSEWTSAGQELLNKVISGVGNKIESLKSKCTSAINSAKTAVTDKYSEWYSAGQNIIEGLKNGIANKAQSLVDKAKGVVNNAIRAAKNLLGIKSPSRVFMRFGEYVDEGFVIGLENYSNRVSKASAGIGQTAIDMMSNTISKLANHITDGVEDPTIKPVIDLSDFDEGIDDMNRGLKGVNGINVSGTYRKATRAFQNGNTDTGYSTGNGTTDGSGNYYFTQNNYSPKALSRIDIYRQTKNQFSAMERAVATT